MSSRIVVVSGCPSVSQRMLPFAVWTPLSCCAAPRWPGRPPPPSWGAGSSAGCWVRSPAGCLRTPAPPETAGDHRPRHPWKMDWNDGFYASFRQLWLNRIRSLVSKARVSGSPRTPWDTCFRHRWAYRARFGRTTWWLAVQGDTSQRTHA